MEIAATRDSIASTLAMSRCVFVGVRLGFVTVGGDFEIRVYGVKASISIVLVPEDHECEHG